MNIFFLLLNIIGIHAISGLNDNFEFMDRKKNYVSTVKQDPPDQTTKWIVQPLDHFDTKEKRTFKMKYIESLKFFKPNSPVFILLAEEIGMIYDFESFAIYSLANATNGAMYMQEHRYYGDSVPLNMTVVQNLKYLSTEQAMADTVHLIQTIKSSPDFKTSKVVVIGCGYGGNLATWLRLKYPHIVDIAWASGAPVLAKKDFFEAQEFKTENFINTTDGCYDMTVKNFSKYVKMLKTVEGIKQLKSEENICESVDMRKQLNKLSFFFSKVLFSYNCFHSDVTSFTSVKDDKCLDYEFSIYALTTFGGPNLPFFYQQCTEFGYFQTTNSGKLPFRRTLTLDFFTNACSLLFGPEFDEKRIDKGVAHTNEQYGGLTPNVTKVVFSSIINKDPFSKLSITKSLSKDAPVRLIVGNNVCDDVWLEDDSEASDVTKAREEIKKIILGWLGSM